MTKKKQEEESRNELLFQIAIRETLMEYYKNSSSNKMVDVYDGIYTNDMRMETRYQYQRRLREMRAPKNLYIAGIQFADMYKNPGEFIIKVDGKRSPEIGKVVDFVVKFFADYLPTVKVSLAETLSSDGEKDSLMMKSIDVRLRNVENGGSRFVSGNDIDQFYTIDSGDSFTVEMVDRARVNLRTGLRRYSYVSTPQDWFGAETVTMPVAPTPEPDVESSTYDPNNPF